MTSSLDPVGAVSQRLTRFLGERGAEVADLGPEAAGFVGAATDALTGGKRLRARFCITGWEAVARRERVNEPLPESVVSAAAALEVFHAAALVHDDIIDNSDTRRGLPAAHRRFEAAHVRDSWAGDAAAFGRSAAILLGDLLVAWSDDLLEEGLVDAPRAAGARRQFAQMRSEVTVGQYLDVAEEAAYRTAPDDEHAERALRVASMKSARYSVMQPLLIGAALAGADAAQRAALGTFGHLIGLAFQLRDDVLGVFGDSAVTGKPTGDDLREGKRTLLIAYAREHLAPSGRRLVDELIGDPDLSPEQIASLQQTIIDTGALTRVEERIAASAREADDALRGADIAPTAAAELRDLARAATRRTA